MRFSKKLKSLRTSKDLTQTQLSNELKEIYNIKFSNRNISYYEREESGATIPDLKIVEALAKYFNVTTNYLLGIKESSQEEEIINRLIQKTESKENNWKKENEIVKDFEEDPSRFHYQRAVSALRNDETSYTLTDKANKLKEIPAHYQIKGLNQPSMEIIDAIVKHNTDDVKEACYLFMILKYLFRFGKKDGVKDLYKAKDFLDRLIEVRE